MQRHWFLFLLFALLCLVGIGSCVFRPWEKWDALGRNSEHEVVIDRYDRVLDEYVSLNSYTALGRMNTQYPTETKLLIEEVLKLGVVNEPDVEKRLRYIYLDSTVQILLDEVHRQYHDVSDIEKGLSEAFEAIRKENPEFRTPHVYTQVACLNQSVVVSDTLIGISLDKYLGADFPLYKDYFTAEQRSKMTREAIVEDAVSAYLLYIK